MVPKITFKVQRLHSAFNKRILVELEDERFDVLLFITSGESDYYFLGHDPSDLYLTIGQEEKKEDSSCALLHRSTYEFDSRDRADIEPYFISKEESDVWKGVLGIVQGITSIELYK